MYVSESEESDKPKCSDVESGNLGQSSQDKSNKQLGDEMYAPSVKSCKTSVACLPKRQDHTLGGKLIETPNLTSPTPLRNTPPTLTCQHS